MTPKPRPRSGFTLIELMIVVNIIAIIAAVAIPNLLRTRTQANEGSAIGSMRSIATAQSLYKDTEGAYGNTLALLGDKELIDNALASGDRAEYHFELTLSSPMTWEATAVPHVCGVTGHQSFYIDQTGIVRVAKCPEKARKASPPPGPEAVKNSFEFVADSDLIRNASQDVIPLLPAGVTLDIGKESIDDVTGRLDTNRDSRISPDEILDIDLRRIAQSIAKRRGISLDQSATLKMDDGVVEAAIAKAKRSIVQDLKKISNGTLKQRR